ncbi:MAG: hypothetical protein ACR2PX_14395 [Endozoicomonas sp.]|uniref:hypothetical protein n=1 Tax=Endozoicomonas sp. TaxID=1892382 RepID=UPI003D9B718C
MKRGINRVAAFLTALISPVLLAGDALPTFTISYFNGACPDGWDNASLSSANGRFLIPSMRGGGVASFVGEALTSQQTPSHTHADATGSISTSSKEFILIDGCCNDSLGDSGTHSMSGSTESASGNLPYIQYNACIKTATPESSAGTLPSGLMTYYMMPQCEASSWTPVYAADGRYPVGLPASGLPGATFGGKALSPGEIRTHDHSMGGTINLPGHDIAGGSGCCAHGYAGAGDTNFTGSTVVDTSSSKYDSAVQAPYYTATFCRKN